MVFIAVCCGRLSAPGLSRNSARMWLALDFVPVYFELVAPLYVVRIAYAFPRHAETLRGGEGRMVPHRSRKGAALHGGFGKQCDTETDREP